MIHIFRPLLLRIFIITSLFPSISFATNGMNLEGYGPIALGAGGASFAYDNGTAAVMNNPATLGLMKETNRLDLAIGFLGPNVDAGSESSSADAFYMPAIGYARRQGDFTFGLGIFAQGGMGTEYANGIYVTSVKERSEVSVGRVIAPLVYQLNEQIHVAASADFVWVGMDLKMAMPGTQFLQLAGQGLITGTLFDTFGGLMGPPLNPVGTGPIHNVEYGYFDFSDDNNFTGEADGTGYAGKIGIVMRPTNKLTLGFTYHSKTRLGDLTTSNANIAMSVTGDFDGNAGTADTTMALPLTGKIEVRDFEWPETYGFGLAVQATDKLMLASDVKIINWEGVMENFKMTFIADQSAANAPTGFPDFRGTQLNATLPQNWTTQTVVSIGAAYKATDALTARIGANLSSNPIPDSTVHYLFPAIVENHVTLGAGFAFTPNQSVDFALSRGLEKTVTDANGTKISHSQLSWQLMYSWRY